MYKTILFGVNNNYSTYTITHAIMLNTIGAYNNKRRESNRTIAGNRKNKSLKLMQDAVNKLKMQHKKPTIMQVVIILKGKLGEATIKKYWRIINPKANTKVEGDTEITITQENNLKYSLQGLGETLLELYIKEWDLKIYKPKYFQIMFKVNQETANIYYQMQFNQNPMHFFGPGYEKFKYIKVKYE